MDEMIGYVVGMFVGSIVAGAIIGLIPYVLGNCLNQKEAGKNGLIACIIGSFLLGVYLSIPACIISCIVIVVKSNSAKNANSLAPIADDLSKNNVNLISQNSSFCHACGKPLKPNSSFCSNCGAKQ